MSITDVLVAVGTVAVPILTYVIWRSQKPKLHPISYKAEDVSFSIDIPPFVSKIIESNDAELETRLAANQFAGRLSSRHVTHVVVANELGERSPEFILEIPIRQAWAVKVYTPLDQADSSVTTEILSSMVQVRFAFLQQKGCAHIWVFSEGFGASIISLASGQISLDRKFYP